MNLSFDPLVAVTVLADRDRRMARLIERAGPFTLRPEKMQSPFQALLRAIVYQQLSGKAAATIFARVKALYPGRHSLQPAAILATDDDALRRAGMSRAKVASVKDLAAKTLARVVPPMAKLRQMDDAEIVARLVSVRGIGPWTVEMLLMFRLGRPDVLPVSDLGVRRGFMLTYKTPEMPAAKRLTEHAERWRPYRSVASWYLWRAVDLHQRSEKAKLRNPLNS
ncbi:MAG TPA: DNA-3-methyladenine glycosylase [Pirellulales bacterium]|nr:DNA-3-methyladenine glycosylase [Pirellulales bacterium]